MALGRGTHRVTSASSLERSVRMPARRRSSVEVASSTLEARAFSAGPHCSASLHARRSART